MDRIVRALSLTKIHPNVLTALGLVINSVAAVLFAQGHFLAAGLVVVAAGVEKIAPLRIHTYPFSPNFFRQSDASHHRAAVPLPNVRVAVICASNVFGEGAARLDSHLRYLQNSVWGQFRRQGTASECV